MILGCMLSLLKLANSFCFKGFCNYFKGLPSVVYFEYRLFFKRSGFEEITGIMHIERDESVLPNSIKSERNVFAGERAL